MAKRSRTLKSEHLRDLAFLSEPHLSADGARAFCVRTTIETPDDGPPSYHPEIVEVSPAGGGEPHVLAGIDGGADHPRLSPDGRWLAFLAKPATGERIKRLRLLDLERGGEARTLAAPDGGVERVVWRPDGAALLLIGRDEAPPPDPTEAVARTVERLHSKKDGLPAPGLRPEGSTGVWFASVPDGKLRRLDAPGDGVEDVAWDPDGRTVWLLGPTDVGEGDAWRSSLWRAKLSKRGKARGDLERIAEGLLAPSALAVSGDGRQVAWLAPSDPTSLSAPTGLWTLDAGGGRATLRTDPDVACAPSVGGDTRHGALPNRPIALPDGWLVNLNREGASAPATVHDDGGVTSHLDGARVVTAFAHAAGRTLCLVETPRTPTALLVIEPGGSTRTLLEPNARFVERYGLVDAEGPFLADNDASGVPWWRLSPTRPRDDAAIVVQVHGGPHTNAGYGFSFEHQLLAARGYTVVYANPRGSSSYGAAHAQALLGGYGTMDADDVLAVVDDAVRTHTEPAAPVHLTGGSYGGFMTNWLVGVTDRFRSAVTQRSICNWTSFYGTSDIGYRFAEHEVQGAPWSNLEELWRQSPLRNAANVTTPVLIVHAEADHRCPIEQAEQWFVALERIGAVDTKLVRFPGEGHELSRSGRPDRRIRRLDEIVAWFEGHP